MPSVATVIRLGVSQCLLGDSVRYDGKHKYCASLQENLNGEFVLEGFCPEVAAGMGVPRPPIQLVYFHSGIEVCDVANTGKKRTRQLTDYARCEMQRRIATLSGFIFKKGSPSCGPEGVAVFNPQGHVLHRQGVGVFAAMIQQQFPQLPVIDEKGFENPMRREQYLHAVRAYFQTQST